MEVVFCDLNPNIYVKLRFNADETTDIAIIAGKIKEAIEVLYTKNLNAPTDFDDALKEFEDIVQNEKLEARECANKLHTWWDRLGKGLKRLIQPLWENIEPCIEGCNSHFTFEYDEVAAFQNGINNFQKRNMSFEVMRDRIMFNPGAVRCQYLNAEAMQYMMEYMPQMDWHGYYVDMSEIHKIYGTYLNNESNIVLGTMSNEEFYGQDVPRKKKTQQLLDKRIPK